MVSLLGCCHSCYVTDMLLCEWFPCLCSNYGFVLIACVLLFFIKKSLLLTWTLCHTRDGSKSNSFRNLRTLSYPKGSTLQSYSILSLMNAFWLHFSQRKMNNVWILSPEMWTYWSSCPVSYQRVTTCLCSRITRDAQCWTSDSTQLWLCRLDKHLARGLSLNLINCCCWLTVNMLIFFKKFIIGFIKS